MTLSWMYPQDKIAQHITLTFSEVISVRLMNTQVALITSKFLSLRLKLWV